jgi:hypothetical protein
MNNFYTANIEMYQYTHQNYENSDQYADYILREAKLNKNSIRPEDDDFLLVTTLLWERHVLDKFDLYKELFDSFKRKKIRTILILDSHQRGKDLRNLETEVHFVDYFLWRSYDKVVRQKKSKVNTTWNRDSKKFLMLNGKPGRVNRIRLLWKLRDQLHNAIWSLYCHDGVRNECRYILPELNDQQFDSFVAKYSKNPDGAKIVFQKNSLHYGGIPYDETLFRDSLFRVITETNFITETHISAWLTEKTFLTILNNLPFIMAGDNNSLIKLKSMGFRTFEDYLPIPGYDEILHPEKKLDAIVTNTRYWLSSMGSKQEIANDVTHNHKRMITLAEENLKNLQDICRKYHIAPSRVEGICTTYDILGQE